MHDTKPAEQCSVNGFTAAECEMILQQWQTSVEMAHLTSQRRDQMNTLFITLNLGLTSCLEWILDGNISLLLAAILSCYIWYRYIQHFRILLGNKYELIHILESNLPYGVYHDEYVLLHADRKYHSGHRLDIVLPLLFSALYVIMLFKALL